MKFTVAAIIPNYNHAHFLRRAITAQMNQTVQPDEIIVINDASTDNSMDVLRELQKEVKQLIVINNPCNKGANESINIGVRYTLCNYVNVISADDEVKNDIYLHAKRMFEQYPEAGLFSGLTTFCCEKTKLKWILSTGMPKVECFLSPEDIAQLGTYAKLTLGGCQSVINRWDLLSVKGWRKDFEWFADGFALTMVALKRGMCFYPESLSNFYLYPDSYYNATKKNYKCRREVMRRMLDSLDDFAYAEMKENYLRTGYLGTYGWSMVRVMLTHPKYLHNIRLGFCTNLAKRSCELIARRLFPRWLCSILLKMFYHK